MTRIETILRTGPVIPVLAIHDLAQAVPIARALVAGGLRVLEVLLRTPHALAAIGAMREVPGAIVGAGTVLDEAQADAALAVGADFIVTPGLTEKLARAVLDRGAPLLPGVSTASDLMRGFDLGLTHFKFFPALASGGLPALSALSGPFAAARFCPTGGITAAVAADWLAHPAVQCVGGSWTVPQPAPGDAPDVAEIEARAREAAALPH